MNLVDIQKTFDHVVFLQKVDCVGFKELIVKWFQPYLPNRNFLVTWKMPFLLVD